MAVVWHSNIIRQYCSIRESDRKYLRDIAVKASYVLLHQLDLLLTILAVSLGLSEINPLIRNLLTEPLQLLGIKVAIPLLIAWLTPSKLLIPAIVFLLMVIGWNVKELLHLLF